MTSKIFYRFANSAGVDCEEVTFTGATIRLWDLKREIMEKLSGRADNTGFDLDIKDADKQTSFSEDTGICNIPKNSTVVVSRIPITQQPRRGRYPNSQQQQQQALLSSSSSLQQQQQVKVNTLERNTSLDDFGDVFAAGNESNNNEEEKQHMMEEKQTTQPPTTKIGFGRQFGGGGRGGRGGTDNIVTKPPGKKSGIPTILQGDGQIGLLEDSSFEEKRKNRNKVMMIDDIRSRIPQNAIPDELSCKLSGELLKEAVMLPCCFKICSSEKITTALIQSGFICPLCKKSANPENLMPEVTLRERVKNFLENARSKYGNDVITPTQTREVEEPLLATNNKFDVVLEINHKNNTLNHTDDTNKKEEKIIINDEILQQQLLSNIKNSQEGDNPLSTEDVDNNNNYQQQEESNDQTTTTYPSFDIPYQGHFQPTYFPRGRGNVPAPAWMAPRPAFNSHYGFNPQYNQNYQPRGRGGRGRFFRGEGGRGGFIPRGPYMGPRPYMGGRGQYMGPNGYGPPPPQQDGYMASFPPQTNNPPISNMDMIPQTMNQEMMMQQQQTLPPSELPKVTEVIQQKQQQTNQEPQQQHPNQITQQQPKKPENESKDHLSRDRRDRSSNDRRRRTRRSHSPERRGGGRKDDKRRRSRERNDRKADRDRKSDDDRKGGDRDRKGDDDRKGGERKGNDDRRGGGGDRGSKRERNRSPQQQRKRRN